MASEKELFVTKHYVPVGPPISENNHALIYRVKCIREPGKPDGVLKIYRKRNIKKLYTQLQALDYSEWPHIYSVKYFDDSTLVVEEFLDGMTLAEHLDQNRSRGTTFSEEEAFQIMEQVCQYIEELMKLNPPIIHHNLKPSNIFVTTAGRIKFLDFEPDYEKKKSSFSKILNILGSLFHEMLTGKKPSNKTYTCGKRYEPIIRKCMETNPQKQYQNIQEMKSDLEYAREHEPEPSRETVKIPYPLTIPFQGILLSFEWLLLSYFYQRDNMPTAVLFIIVFLVHCGCFAIRRRSFLCREQVSLGLARTLLPILALGGVFACLSLAVRFFLPL